MKYQSNYVHLQFYTVAETLTNLGGGSVTFRLFRLTSWPFCAHATRRKDT